MPALDLENTEHAVYDPQAPEYWDEASLQKEIERTFEICHGCRMCFKYCSSFPSLFQAIDQTEDGDVLKLTNEDTQKVVDECFQCKICYIKCPYTDQDKHVYDLNFPALMQRASHVRAKKRGVRFQDKVLQNADLAGKLSSGLISYLVNTTFNSEFHRKIFQALLGIHKNKKMPKFHMTTFSRWFRKRRKPNRQSQRRKVVLFSTCFVNYNNPQVGKDAVFVLEKNNIEVIHPPQNCCGMPGLNSGDLNWAVRKMTLNVKKLYPFVKKGYKILAVNPTCSMTLKKEYASFLPKKWQEKGLEISRNTMDLHEYLFEVKKDNDLNREFRSTPEKIGYHVPCHLRAQNIGYRSRDIMKLIPQADVQIVDECCGHNGNWAMKKENFELSLKVGKKAFDSLKEKGPDQLATDCPLAAIQIQQGMGSSQEPYHPIQILAKSYKKPQEGGFVRATLTAEAFKHIQE